MELPFPDSPTHPVTEEGKALHWAIDRVIMSWSPRNTLEPIELRSFLGAQCPENGVIITDTMVGDGLTYLEHVWSIGQHNPHALLTELQVSAHSFVPGLKGRIDTTWHSEDYRHVVIWDFKYGYNPVAAFENWQLICYALGMLTDATQIFDLFIVQPRNFGPVGTIRHWRLTPAELMAYASTVIDAAILARGPNPPTRAGAHCHHCKAAAHCATLAAATYAAMDVAGEATAVEIDERQIGYELVMLGAAKEKLRARLDSMEALASSRIKAGKVIPGYEERRAKSNRQWTHSGAATTIAFGRLAGVDLETERKAVSPRQAEARGVPRKLIDLYTEQHDGAAKLVCVDPTEAREVFRNGR